MENRGDARGRKTSTHFLPVPLLGRNAMVLLLAWVAGSIDALSYLGLGHVFTANMTGNTVLLGLAIGQGQGVAAVRSLIALGGFLVGVALGALIVARDRTQEDWPLAVTGAVALEVIILGAFALTWFFTGTGRSEGIVSLLIALAALAMGLQSMAVRHLGVAGIVTTYITGTWTSFAAGLIGGHFPAKGISSLSTSAKGPATPLGHRPHGLKLQGAVLLSYSLAAVVTGFGEAHWSAGIPFLSLFAVVLVAVNASIRQRYRPSPSSLSQ